MAIKKTARLIAFYSAIIMATLLLAEFVILPRALSLPRDMLLMRFVALPGSTVDNQRINDMGFTGDTLTREKPANTIRILVLGSSTMFNRHMGERLKASLQAHSPYTVELLDAGLRSHTSRSDLLKYRALQDYHFDYVIYYNGINDLLANHVEAGKFQADYSHMDPWYSEGPVINHSIIARMAYVFKGPVINALLRKEPPENTAVFPKKDYENLARFRSIQTFSDNLERIIGIARHQHATPVLMTFASAIPENYSSHAFKQQQMGYTNPDHYNATDLALWGSPDYVKEGLARINDAIKTLAQRTGADWIDMDRQLSGNMLWFSDPCHFSDEGVDTFIRITTDYFKQQGWLDRLPE